MIETMVEHVASALQIPADIVRETNMYKPGDITPCGQKLDYCNAREVFSTLKVINRKRLQKITYYTSKYNTLFNCGQSWLGGGCQVRLELRSSAEFCRNQATTKAV